MFLFNEYIGNLQLITVCSYTFLKTTIDSWRTEAALICNESREAIPESTNESVKLIDFKFFSKYAIPELPELRLNR